MEKTTPSAMAHPASRTALEHPGDNEQCRGCAMASRAKSLAEVFVHGHHLAPVISSKQKPGDKQATEKITNSQLQVIEISCKRDSRHADEGEC